MAKKTETEEQLENFGKMAPMLFETSKKMGIKADQLENELAGEKARHKETHGLLSIASDKHHDALSRLTAAETVAAEMNAADKQTAARIATITKQGYELIKELKAKLGET